MNKTASEFLKREDIIKPNHTSFFIQFDDGSQIELTEVLNKYHQEQLKLCGVINWVAVKNNIKPEYDTEILTKFRSGKVRLALFSSADNRFYNPVNDQDISEFVEYYTSMPK